MSMHIYHAFRLLFGTLYPAYASYKAVKTKNVKEYVKWMMYWIVFAFFTCAETISDIFVSWIPFYYEMKILFVLWLLSPATKGSSILYRKLVHPQLTKREKEIDSYIAKASNQGYSALVSLGTKGFSYATNIVLSTAIKGQSKIADHLRKSYSLNDLSQDDSQRFHRQESEISEAEDDIDNDDSRHLPETDNRIIEDCYQSEMHEKEMEDDSEGAKIRRRRSQRTKETELQPVEEEDDEGNRKPKLKKSYSHKEDAVRPSVPSLTRSTPTTPTPVFPGYTPFARYSRSSSWEPKTQTPSAAVSWRSRSSYTSQTDSPKTGRRHSSQSK